MILLDTIIAMQKDLQREANNLGASKIKKKTKQQQAMYYQGAADALGGIKNIVKLLTVLCSTDEEEDTPDTL